MYVGGDFGEEVFFDVVFGVDVCGVVFGVGGEEVVVDLIEVIDVWVL